MLRQDVLSVTNWDVLLETFLQDALDGAFINLRLFEHYSNYYLSKQLLCKTIIK
jgi:hypothetical protein